MDESAGIEPPETPELFKIILWLWHQARQHAGLLVKPPVIIAIILAAWVGYLFAKYQGSESAHIANDRIAALKERVDAYKDRLNGATPDEAAQQIGALKDRVSILEKEIKTFKPSLPGRHLTEEQRSLLIQNAKSEAANLGGFEMAAISDTEARQYCRELWLALKAADVKIPESNSVLLPYDIGVDFDAEHGIVIAVVDPEKPPSQAAALKRVLEAAKLKATYFKTQLLPPQGNFFLGVAQRWFLHSSLKITPSISSATKHARKNVAASVPRLSLFAIDASVSSRRAWLDNRQPEDIAGPRARGP